MHPQDDGTIGIGKRAMIRKRSRGSLVWLSLAIAALVSTGSDAQAVPFRQPGFDAANTGKLPFSLPTEKPPPADYTLSTLFSSLSSPNVTDLWIPLASPVVDSAGTAYWGLKNFGVGVRLISIPIASPPTIRSSLNLSNDRAIDEYSTKAKEAFVSLAANDVVLVMYKIKEQATGFRCNKADSILSSFSFPVSTAYRFEPVMDDAGSAAYVVAVNAAGLPCVFRVDLSTGETACRDLGLAAAPQYVSLALDDRAQLLITADGASIRTAYNDLPAAAERFASVRNTTAFTRLRAVPGRNDVALAVAFDGAVSLFNTTAGQPWTPLWTSSLAESSFAVAVDTARDWLYVCLGAASDVPAAQGRLVALKMSDGQVAWNGGATPVPCSKDAVLVSSDSSVLTLSQGGTMSLLRYDDGAATMQPLWSTVVPPLDPTTNFPFLPAAVFSRGGNQTFIFSGANAVGFEPFPPALTTTSSTTSSATPSSTDSSNSGGNAAEPTTTGLRPTSATPSTVASQGVGDSSSPAGLSGISLILAIALPLVAFAVIAAIVAAAVVRRRRRSEVEKQPHEPPVGPDGAPPRGMGDAATVGAGTGIVGISTGEVAAKSKFTSGPDPAAKVRAPASLANNGDSTLLAAGVGAGAAAALAVPFAPIAEEDEDDNVSYKSANANPPGWNDATAGRRESFATIASEDTIRSPPQLGSPERSAIVSDSTSVTPRATLINSAYASAPSAAASGVVDARLAAASAAMAAAVASTAHSRKQSPPVEGEPASPVALPSTTAGPSPPSQYQTSPSSPFLTSLGLVLARSSVASATPSAPEDTVRPHSVAFSVATTTSSTDSLDYHRPPSSTPSSPSMAPSNLTSPNSRAAQPTLSRNTSLSRATSPSAASSFYTPASSGYAASVSSAATPRPRDSMDRLSRTTSPRNSLQSLGSTASSDLAWDAAVAQPIGAPVIPMPAWLSDDEDGPNAAAEEERWRDLVFGDRRSGGAAARVAAAAAARSGGSSSSVAATTTDAESFVTVPETGSDAASRRTRGTTTPGSGGAAAGRGRGTATTTPTTDNEGGYTTAASSFRSATTSPGPGPVRRVGGGRAAGGAGGAGRVGATPSDGYVTARESESGDGAESGTDGYVTGREG
ncbi:hypothetical protein HDU96_006606 [Phlyctochytrium bullatum]|nr:hypothetical protein HDU96_006606 [Phlyctochytrium bullatum]